MKKQTLMWPALGVLVTAMTLGGCSRRDDMTTATAPNSNDTVVAQAEPRARDNDLQAGARQAGQDASRAVGNAADAVSDKVADAVITTSVNAELAKDKALSATKINVDTEAGRVALRGTAPSEVARERATQLASNVKGVVNVDNQLKVEPAKM